MLPREAMCAAARKLRDTYAITPGAPFVQREFGYYSLEGWMERGMPQDVPRETLFGFDPPGGFTLRRLGWCEAAFQPTFDEMVLDDRGNLELVQDAFGRHVLCFKGRRRGFMPEYLDHPVKDMRSWEEKCKWRLHPSAAGRYDGMMEQLVQAREMAAQGGMVTQKLVGGYMYLRSLIGPVDLLYKFHDEPALIHACMENWLKLADAVTAAHQFHEALKFYDGIAFQVMRLVDK